MPFPENYNSLEASQSKVLYLENRCQEIRGYLSTSAELKEEPFWLTLLTLRASFTPRETLLTTIFKSLAPLVTTSWSRLYCVYTISRYVSRWRHNTICDWLRPWHSRSRPCVRIRTVCHQRSMTRVFHLPRDLPPPSFPRTSPSRGCISRVLIPFLSSPRSVLRSLAQDLPPSF